MHETNYKISDEAYGEVLNNFVIGCVDTLVIYEDSILLVKREDNPIKGEWWIFGGRMLIGESFQRAAQRGVQREVGLFVGEDRFLEIGAFNLIWPVRREPEETSGCHHLLIAHLVRINDTEFRAVSDFIRENNVDARWFTKDELNKLILLKEMRAIIEKAFNIQTNE